MPSRIRQYEYDSVERIKKPIVVKHPVTRVYQTTRHHSIPDEPLETLEEPAPQVQHKKSAIINRVKQTTSQMMQRIQKKQYY